MISGLLVLVLGDILAQPGKFSDLAFVIAFIFAKSVFGGFATAKTRSCV